MLGLRLLLILAAVLLGVIALLGATAVIGSVPAWILPLAVVLGFVGVLV